MSRSRRRFRRMVYWSILRLQRARCARCGKRLSRDYQFDHAIPLWLGGDDTPDNLQALCVGCHKIKTAIEAHNRAKGKRIQKKHQFEWPRLGPKPRRPKVERRLGRLGSRKYKRKVDGSVVIRDDWEGDQI